MVNHAEQLAPTRSTASLGTDFSMPGEVEDGYSAAMAGIAALQLDGDTFGASSSGQDSLLGLLTPAGVGAGAGGVAPPAAMPASSTSFSAFQNASQDRNMHANLAPLDTVPPHGSWNGNEWAGVAASRSWGTSPPLWSTMTPWNAESRQQQLG